MSQGVPMTVALHRTHRSVSAAAIAGITFAAAWIVGIALSGSGPDVTAPDAEVLRHYASHGGAAPAQPVLVDGVPAAALFAVVVAVPRRSPTVRNRRAVLT